MDSKIKNGCFRKKQITYDLIRPFVFKNALLLRNKLNYMNQYLILQHPGHNRVYFNFAGELALGELHIACTKLEIQFEKLEIIKIERIRYISLKTNNIITEKELEYLSRLSFIFAIFKANTDENNQISLTPIPVFEYEYVDNKISTILKYAGKTNESFTKMMVNIALLSSDFSYDDTIELLDPVAGKGTTLYEGMVYGFNVAGIEIDKKPVHEMSTFFKKYLETERYKHTADKRQIFGKNRSEAVYVDEFEFSVNKEDFKSDGVRHKLSMVNGKAQEASHYYKNNQFHLIVGDLPYGISHGSSTNEKSNSNTRNPLELLTLSLPHWDKILKVGGVVVISWNTFIIARHRLFDVFTDNGFTILNDYPYNNFEHMVDKSIKRDFIVAKKTS